MTRDLRLCLTILVSLALLSSNVRLHAQDSGEPDAIEWSSDLDGALKQSRRDGKPVLAYFTFNACYWCKKLEEDTYTDSDVIQMVMANFHPVKVNRDDTPEIPPRFNMSAYPSLITLGPESEKIHRFSSYMLPDEFKENLQEALRRHALYKDGQEWDTPNPRPDTLTDDPDLTIQSFDAPTDAVPAGFAKVGQSLYLAQNGALFELDERMNVVRKLPLDSSVLDITSDGTHIYALSGGWTAGDPIFVIDPATGDSIRSIVTQANATNRSHGAKGIAHVDGHLYVLEGMNGIIHQIDPATGEIIAALTTNETWLTSLAFDGKHFITGARDKILLLNRQGTAQRTIKTNYPVRSVGVHNEALLVMEQPIFGFDKKHNRVQIWPEQTRIYKLKIKSKDSPQIGSDLPPLGSRENPVLCDMPQGQRAYLQRLRCKDGSKPSFTRVGSFGAGPDGHILDGYELTCPGTKPVTIFLDMYHTDHVEPDAIPGFDIVDR